MSRESDAQEGLKVIDELAAAAKAGDPEAQAFVSTPALDFQHRMMSPGELEELMRVAHVFESGHPPGSTGDGA